MKRVNSLIVVVVLVGGLLLALALSGAVGPTMPEVQAQELGDMANAVAEGPAQPVPEAGGMSGWPIPSRPIPHHEPGQPARSGNASHQVTRLNAQGEEQTVELRGLDALLADGAITDPLQGNYNLVGLDKVMFGAYNWDADPNDFSVQSLRLVTPTLELIPDSTQSFGDMRFTDIAAGDLNGDHIDEQIVAWVDRADNHIYMQVGELPGSLGKTTSAPAVVAHPDGSLDVVARGYDQALWRLHYDGAAWGQWNNAAGGWLLSAPAVASRASGELDVFAVGDYNQLYHTQWADSSWSAWMPIDGGAVFITETVRSVPLPEIPAPAVAARGGAQLDLFRLGPDNTVWWLHYDDGDWGAWQNLGGMLASGPGAVSLTGGGMEVYALGMDGALWYRTYNGGWGGWKRLATPDGVAGNAVPVLTSPAAGRVAVYLAGTENRIWSIQRNGTSWGSWDPTAVDVGEIELGLGIGAAAGPAGAHLFAQMSDGSLQNSLNATGWARLDGLVVSQTFDTGAVTKALPPDDEIENPIFDITTGYFSGDGRQQVVLAYVGANNRLRLEVYDIRDGFVLTKTAELTQPLSAGSGYPRIAAGDVDGDGVDEIGLAYIFDNSHYQVRVFEIERATNGNWTGQLVQRADSTPQRPWDLPNYGFGGTLQIVAGDVAREPGTRSPNDEFVLASDWRKDESGLRFLLVDMSLYDEDPVPSFSNPVETPIYVTATRMLSGMGNNAWSGVALAVGNVADSSDTQGIDEIIVTLPFAFLDGWWPALGRKLFVYNYDDTAETKLVEREQWGGLTVGWSKFSFLDTLAVGDLDQDLVDEIVLAADSETTGYWLYVTDFETLGTSVGYIDRYQLPYTHYFIPRAFNLAMGDFTGESVRVGPPSYRVQTQMTTPEVFLNLPPMHRDIVSGAGEIEIFNGAQATHSAGNSTSASSTAESKRDWSLSAGMETSIGVFGNTVTASMKNTYGENFSTSTTQISTTEFEDTTTADNYDQVIYNGTDYAIWEYPVYGVPGDDQDEPRTISVVFPLVATTSQPVTQQGRTCDENFYVPSHQPYNVWSYDPMGSGVDFDDYGRQIETKQTSGGSDFVVRMSAVSAQERSASFHNQFSAGLEYSYENELNIPFVGKAWDFSFRASMDGSFGHENNSTLSTSFTEASTVQVDFPSTADPSNYAIKAYLYWAKAGYLVVDYQTQPTNAGSWLLYNKPDPAFILPWYGFPDPATGVFPSPPHPDAPPCGLDRQLFTHDIEVDPGYAQNGDTVTITATVRNFSNVNPPQNVAVRFYLGDPTTGSPIGTCTILRSRLDRDLGPQRCAITWVVSGAAGEEKIYARIDPNNAFDEMHDEGDVINNNVGFGLLYVASADYFDPGLRQTQAYQAILYEDVPRLGFGLYLPTKNISETVRYELVPTSLGNLRIVGQPIQVLAFRGGEQEPEDDHNFGPIPAGMMALYRDSDLLPGMVEGNLKLYRQDGSNWVPATCPGYQIVRFAADNRIAFPICQTGVFVLSDAPPGPTAEEKIYLPQVLRAAR